MTISVLRDEIQATEARLQELRERLNVLEQEQARERFSCECVRLNKDLGILDMAQQERANRVALHLGYVGLTLSADRSCTRCHGAGA